MRIFTFLLVLFLFASAKAQTDTLSLVRYRGYGIELEIPATWKVMQDYSKDAKIMFSNADTTGGDSTIENITVVIENAPLFSLRSYFKSSKRNLTNRLLNPIFIAEGAKQVASYNSQWLIMTHRFAGRTFKAKLYYFFKQGVAYIFILTVAPEDFEEFEAIGDMIMETLILSN